MLFLEISATVGVNLSLEEIVVADAHRGGKRFVVRSDERLSAFMELEWTIVSFSVSPFFRVNGTVFRRQYNLP